MSTIQKIQTLTNTKACLSKKTLLIIDDDIPLNSLLCHALKSKDYEIVTVDCAAAGLLAAEKLQPDLILLDLCLPDLDGLTVLAKLRLQDHKTRVILTSCLPASQWKTEAIAAGVDDVLEKPYNLFTINKALGLLGYNIR